MTLFKDLLYLHTDTYTWVTWSYLIFMHKHLLVIHAKTVSSTCTPLLYLIKSISFFISHLKCHLQIWEAFLKASRQS